MLGISSVMLGQRIRQLRREKSFTLQQVADALGVTRACVSKWETGRSQPDLDSIDAIGAFFGLTASELLATESFDGALKFRDYPVITLENGIPLNDLIQKYSGLRRYPCGTQASSEAFFVSVEDFMATNFGLKEFKSNTLLLIDPSAEPTIGDLVLTLTLNLGYQVLAVKVNAGQPEYFSLGAKLSQLGALQGVEVLGLVIEAIHNENLKGYALRHVPELLLRNLQR
jgi:transcriptional regulator with XRE-family HTH domain